MDIIQSEKIQAIQNKITDSMMALFNSVKQKKSEEYKKGSVVLVPENVDKMIVKCGNINAAVSGGVGLIPGPWGMAAAVPEVMVIIKNQIELIYDIGIALGKEDHELSTELLLGVFASTSGVVGIGLLTIHGGRIFVKRASLQVMQKIITLLGGRVTQKLLKSMVAKWLPGIGAAAMATWAKVSTNMIGKRAVEYLSLDIAVDEDTLVMAKSAEKDLLLTAVPDEDVIKNRIIILCNLMKIDGTIASEEIKYISTIIENVDISDELTFELLDIMKSPDKGKVDYSLLKEGDEPEVILIDMLALSRSDGEEHYSETIYIKQAGKSLGLPDDVINEIMSAKI